MAVTKKSSVEAERWNKPIGVGGKHTADNVVRLYAASKTDIEIARHLTNLGFSTSRDAVRRRRTQLGLVKEIGNSGGSPAGVRPIIGQSPYIKYDSPPVIEADNLIIMPDIQFPYHHADFANRVLDLCNVLEIKTCIWAGDAIENSSLTQFDPNWATEGAVSAGIEDKVADQMIDLANRFGGEVHVAIRQLLSEYGRKVNNNPAGVSEEWAYARREMSAIVNLFDQIEWIIGNHEGRILRQMQSPFFAEDLRRLFVNDKVHISPYYYCLVKSGEAEWRITHPKSSGKGDARWYASKYLTNVIMAHNHQLVMQKDRSGKYWAIEAGMMVDETRLPYVAQRDTKADNHLLGAVLILNGNPLLLYEDSPWAMLKRLK